MPSYSNSQLQSYKNCPLQWRYYWDLHLRRLDDETSDHHLRYGNAIHKGLEQLYRGNGLVKAREAFTEAYPTQLDPNDKAKTQANGLVALVEYAKHWREEDRQWRVIELETHHKDDQWSVKTDMVLENVVHGGIYLVDNKTTGQYLNYRYWERFEPNSQITYYLDHGIHKYGQIEGFIINAISFRYREKKYKDEPAGFWCKFERQMFNRNPSQLEFERESRRHWIVDIERSRANQFWRTNTDSCWRCQYRPICAAGWTWEDDAELIKNQYYQACDQLFNHDDHCTLAQGHDGEHGFRQIESSFELEVEV